MILDSLLDDDGLGILLIVPLIMESHGGSIQYLFLAISEAVLLRCELPFVFSSLLLAWGIVAMRFSVHCVHLFVLVDMGSSEWEEHFLGTFQAGRGHTEYDGTSLGLLWPVIFSGETFA